jgi:hypothetical protein
MPFQHVILVDGKQTIVTKALTVVIESTNDDDEDRPYNHSALSHGLGGECRVGRVSRVESLHDRRAEIRYEINGRLGDDLVVGDPYATPKDHFMNQIRPMMAIIQSNARP